MAILKVRTKIQFLFPLTLVLALNSILYAQDVHFTQFDASPLSLNPGNTGNFNGFWRFSANFRSQWRVLDFPFTSYSAGYERNLVDKGSNLAIGFYALHDEAGQANLSYDKFYASIATSVGDDFNRLSFGIQPGFVSKRINGDQLLFPNQYNSQTGLHDRNISNGEDVNDNTGYFDVNAGISWQRIFPNEHVLKMGIAGFHLTRPNESLVGGEARTPIRKVFHASYALPISERWILMPKVLIHEQVRASEYLVGTYFINLVGQNSAGIQSFFIGSLGRMGINRNVDAFSAILGVNYERWDIGISYDINVSTLQSITQNRGAIEFSVIFWNGKVRLNRTTIICERF